MIKELEYFNIGGSYGGNQNWMRDPWMHIGGCGALTACDMCIYLAMYRGKEELYPYALPPARDDYMGFAKLMKPYLKPRRMGIDRIETYMEEFDVYLKDRGVTGVALEGIPGTKDTDTAWGAIRESIDEGIPLCCLTLRHRDREFDFFEWHWYVLNGYVEDNNVRKVKAATYGRSFVLDFDRLWDTGYEQKGGLVVWKLFD